MWIGVTSQAAWLVIVVSLNSVIHTLMYTYFGAKTLYPKWQCRWAKYLTKAQIGQFFTGLFVSTCATIYVMDKADCMTPSSTLGLACFHVYAYGLIALFCAFAARKYRNKKADKQGLSKP